MMRAKEHLAMLLAYGPETRAFLYSGLAERLTDRYRITLCCYHERAKAVASGFDFLECELADVTEEPRLLRKVREISCRLHSHGLARRGIRKWSHFLGAKGRPSSAERESAWFRAVASPILVRMSSRFESWLGRARGTSGQWKRRYERWRTAGVVSSAWDSRTMPALQTAANLGKRVFLIANSWKDVFVNSHVPVTPSACFVWSPRERQRLLDANSHWGDDRVRVSGSLHLSPLRDRRRLMQRVPFCRENGLDADRPFVCYTAASPKAVCDEERIVEQLADAMRRAQLPGRPQLLVRINPMEDGQRFREIERKPDVVLQRPMWEWSSEAAWNAPYEADTGCWASTVHHAALNVSIASSVTLEFAALRRPVVNVCFDAFASVPRESSNARFWNADFYEDVRTHRLAVPAYSIDDALEHIGRGLSQADPNPHAGREAGLEWLDEDAVSNIERTVGQFLG